ncbi:hypothetical protein ACU4GD_11725 [Cupriavidus basilensis]
MAQGQPGSTNAGTHAGAGGDLSLQRFLDRATALRLRLQQLGNSADADAQARQMAQALFQGKGSELADTQAYAQLMAASLGSQWAGMGETLFVRPIAQATQTVLQPAQASLNEAWRQSIAMTWSRSFAGRYPFADTANDASLAELARFLRPQSGLIGSFTRHAAGGRARVAGRSVAAGSHRRAGAVLRSRLRSTRSTPCSAWRRICWRRASPSTASSSSRSPLRA